MFLLYPHFSCLKLHDQDDHWDSEMADRELGAAQRHPDSQNLDAIHALSCATLVPCDSLVTVQVCYHLANSCYTKNQKYNSGVISIMLFIKEQYQ